MGFSSADALYNAITIDGKILAIPFSKTIQTGATSAASRWHECFTAGGTGGVGVLTGTPGTGIIMDATKAGALPIGPAVEAGMTKHLLAMSLTSPSATIAPAYVMLTDILHVYPSLVEVTTPSTLSNHPTWTGTGDTRMTNAKGVQLSMIQTTASSVAGALTPTYTDQDSNSQACARALQGAVAAHPVGALWGDTGVNATVGGPCAALAVGDYGVRQVTSYAIGTGATGGAGAMILHRPICTIPLAAVNTPTERDFSTGPIRLPRIYDNSCLALLVMVGGALTTGQIIEGELVLGWA